MPKGPIGGEFLPEWPPQRRQPQGTCLGTAQNSGDFRHTQNCGRPEIFTNVLADRVGTHKVLLHADRQIDFEPAEPLRG